MSSGSGVQVNDECHKKFEELKLGKKIKFVIFKLNDTMREIVVASSSMCDGVSDPEKIHENLLKEFKEDECCYAAYDFTYESGEGQRSKILFIPWNPSGARIKQKMVYASSKTALQARLGLSSEIQATDYDEVDYNTVLEKVRRK